MQIPAVRDVQLYTAAGVAVGIRESLVNGTTYYGELIAADAPWTSVLWKWDSSIIATITVESTNLDAADPNPALVAPDFWGGLRTWDAAALGWWPEPDAALTVTIAGGSASARLVHMGGGGARRMRAKIVVGAANGRLRGRAHGKMG
jgi:hypothetical protein